MNFLKKHKEIILYLIFGVLTTAVNFIAFLIFGLFIGEELYLLSNVLAWVAAVAFAFAVNKLFVFGDRSADGNTLLAQILKFAGARLFSLGVEELGLFLLVDVCNMGEVCLTLTPAFSLTGQMIAKCILAAVVIIMNYFFSKLIIFKSKDS